MTALQQATAQRLAHREAPRRAITVPAPPRPSLDVPKLLVALPNGEQAQLPGDTWPALAVQQPRRRAGGGGGSRALLDVVEIDMRAADRLLARFAHPLPGASRRPFGLMAYALRAFGEPVAVCVSASAPNTSVHKGYGLHRRNTVELARIARRDQAATLAALRLWREYLAPLYAERYASAGWGEHELRAAISYSLPGTPASSPDGHGIYRRDGWVCIRRRRVSNPGPNSGWSRPSIAKLIDNGIAGLWVWWYGDPPLLVNPDDPAAQPGKGR